ncbi:MAG: inositol monophosphatase family protein [Hydrogenophilus thermoluteolus]|jgi:myo-inositol-1(or 4)-monophosphatase|nr:inositol monophosphatase family protein [Hydrogenophilus thermoluteolus]MBW7657540.1 inositol monophosphatase [Hydrogenophilus thermoluteolus]HNQ48380.1 inositol monophosphatase family protein [Hydrogenophilus thermoluteolus]
MIVHPTLNIAIKAARRAAQIINRAALQLERLTIERKAQNDFVTEIDRAAETAIIETIREVFPDDRILAEESGASGAESKGNEWIIDPLDGTTNFIHGLPQFAISIAVRRHGVLEHAVVFDPSRNELFCASRGSGAYLNERRIRVSRLDRLSDALIGTGFPFRQGQDLDTYLAIFKALMRKTAGLRRPGAASLDLCYVACGRYDGFFESGLSPWDIAAGALIVQEAGGFVTDWQGTEHFLETGAVVAGNPKVFAALVAEIQKQLAHRS